MPTSTNRKSKHKEFSPSIKGTIDISKQGVGYVTIKDQTIDILIRRENIKNAMQGDTVEVSIFKVGKANKRPEGVITKIVKRAQNELIGTVQLNNRFAFIIPDNKSFTKDIFINEKNSVGLKNGDRVVVKITDWNDKLKNPEGEILHTLTDERVNEIAMKEILLQQGFSLEFSEEVIKESEAIPTQISEEEIAKRKDMRSILTMTIDPQDAKDFDDAISFRKLKKGMYEVGVHIADVAHYVKPGTALDQEAYSRATSVYLPDRVLPMLPEKISNELCSLRPNEDKLTFSTVFQLDETGQVHNYWIGKTVIHSDKRFAYEDVQQIIETKEGEHKEVVLLLHTISQNLRKQKFTQGAINFSSEEVRFILDEERVPIDVTVKQSMESHQLIEELMLLANRTVAEHVSKIKINKASIPFPYRIHDSPDIDKLTNFTKFAGRFGYKFDLSSPATISTSFNKMITAASQIPAQSILQTLGIRTMAKAVYSMENIGHYGLAFPFYCHFTSPIRRYPDVLVHRILLECIEKNIHPIKAMEEMCQHCSDRERKAMEAERDANKYKQVEYMRKFIGGEFDAIISGVSTFGFWAQTVDHKCEGFLSTAGLIDLDDFQYDEEQYALIGKRTKKKFQMGQAVHVKVVSANLVKKQIDFDWVK